MPGVYIHANVLDTLLNGRAILPAHAWLLFAVSLLPLGVLLGGFLVLSPRRSLLQRLPHREQPVRSLRICCMPRQRRTSKLVLEAGPCASLSP